MKSKDKKHKKQPVDALVRNLRRIMRARCAQLPPAERAEVDALITGVGERMQANFHSHAAAAALLRERCREAASDAERKEIEGEVRRLAVECRDDMVREFKLFTEAISDIPMRRLLKDLGIRGPVQ